MISKKFLSGAALTALSLAAGTGVAFAQSTSSGIRGTVLSDTGEPVANASVVVTHVPSGTTSTAETNETGSFYTPGLRVGGPYSVSIDAEGFESSDATEIYLDAGEIEPLRVTLFGAEDLVVVGVRANVSLNNGAGSAFDDRDIANQPSITRDVIRTLLIDPITQSSGTGNLSVAGVNPRFNGLTIDGSAQKDDLGLGANTYATERSPINLDAVESASVVASDYSVTSSGFVGGLVNIVTRSGTNEFDGALFYYFADEEFVGTTADDNVRVVTAPFEETEQGISIGGPIIRDRLFFFLSYDEFESASGVDFSTTDANNGVEEGFFEALNDLVLDTYGIDMGGRPTTAGTPITSERFLAKLDWNINDDHRASFTYQSAEETGVSVSSTSFTGAWYAIPVELTAYTAQLFSDWTPNLSTAFRVNYKEFSRGQICGAGADTPELIFDLSAPDLIGSPLEGLLDSSLAASDRNFVGGCDRFRHANAYNDSRLQLFASAEYTLGSHILTFGGEYQEFELFNLFVERASGQFTFETYDEIVNGDALISYANATSNDANDAASAWGYNTWAVFIQDSWQLTPRFTLDYGLRYERLTTDDNTPEDAAVEAAYGFDPQNSLDGLDLIMPRVSFRWDATDRTRLTGGFGLFAGGNPNVWFSNAYQPPVVNPFPSGRTADAAGVPDLTVTGLIVPDSILTATSLGTPRIIDIIDPDFEIPSDWKASLRLEQEFDAAFGGIDFGSDYLLTLQVLYTQSRDGFLWRNLAQTELPAAQPTGVAPDGRTIYADLQALGIPNLTMLTNGDGGESTVYSISLQNSFDNGFEFSIGYAYQDIEAISEGSSSRGISSWRGIVADDRNFPEARISPYEVEHTFRITLGYEQEFFAGLESRFDLFGNITSGAPFTYTFDVANNNSLFGRAGGGENPFDNNPLYIPLEGGDPLVVYRSTFNQGAFFDYINSRGISQGEIHEVNADESTWNQRWDFRFQQELPLPWGRTAPFVGDNRLRLVFDVQNVLNLLNDEWGTQYNGPANNQLPLVAADLISVTDANYISGNYNAATALTGDAARTTCVTEDSCVYRYNTFTDRPLSTRSNTGSVYRIRVGIRYEF
jgi:hypothetical protein